MSLVYRKISIVVVGSFLFFSSCSKKDSVPSDPFDPAIAKIIIDHAYGSLPMQKADVYLPANRSTATKTMIFIHGGFWTGGDKSELDTLIAPIQKEDPSLAIININYRVADGNPANQHPAQMNDFSRLLDYVDSMAPIWHIGKRYAFTGVSAGAHLALLYTYKFDNSKRVKLVTSVLGPTNLADPYYTQNILFQQIVSSYLGKTWSQDPSLHVSASPVSVVTATAPPTFMAYGGADPLVPVSNPDTLRSKLTMLNVPHVYHLYPGESHDMSSSAILDIIKKMNAFFMQYL